MKISKKLFLKNKELKRLISDEEACLIYELKDYPVLITNYFSSLIKWKDISDPLRRQIIPFSEERQLKGIDDFCEERNFQKMRYMIHKYPDRVVIYATNRCFGHCRFCFRKWLWKERKFNMDENAIKRAGDYLNKHKDVREVILSGGDPLTLSNSQLKRLLTEFSGISNLVAIRIASRALTFYPARIDPGLIKILRLCNKQVWFISHFNHPLEISNDTMFAIKRLVRGGIPVLNQTVLLKGINDRVEVLVELFNKLCSLGVKPYYLFQCDPAPGAVHFSTELENSFRIMEKLAGHSGLITPRFALEIRGYGKISPGPGWCFRRESDGYEVESPSGGRYYYPGV